MLYVPAESLNAYKAAWGVKFSDIRPISTGGVEAVEAGNDGMSINVSGSLLSVTSQAAVAVYNVSGVKVAGSETGVLSTALPAGVYVIVSGGATAKVSL